MEELLPSSPGRENVSVNTDTASTHASQGDPAGISTEVCDILLDPAERQVLVLQSLVTRDLCAGESEEAQGSQPVVDGDNHQAGLHQQVHVHPLECSRTNFEASSVDPEEDRSEVVDVRCGLGKELSVDVEKETILVADNLL